MGNFGFYFKLESQVGSKVTYDVCFEEGMTIENFLSFVERRSYKTYEGGKIDFIMYDTIVATLDYTMGAVLMKGLSLDLCNRLLKITAVKSGLSMDYKVVLLPPSNKMSISEAIEILEEQAENYSTKDVGELVEVKMAYAKAILILKALSNRRTTQYLNGKLRTNYCTEANPCGCGVRCFHYEHHLDSGEIYGVCNGCGKDIYTVEKEFKEEILGEGDWVILE
jgi:hypothetical protein